jgi:hypothetical protein
LACPGAFLASITRASGRFNPQSAAHLAGTRFENLRIFPAGFRS